jgi:RimJ/RimL family protein N-acetyltransferase
LACTGLASVYTTSNLRAQRVYEKCGFSHEGRLRRCASMGWPPHDQLLMAILHSDPRPDS